MFVKVVLELAELREVETAHHLLRETAPMSSLKQANPERQGTHVITEITGASVVLLTEFTMFLCNPVVSTRYLRIEAARLSLPRRNAFLVISCQVVLSAVTFVCQQGFGEEEPF